MITICRAEDGQIFPINASIRDIEGIGSLELFLHQEIGVDEEAAVSYLSDGRRLTNANLRDLGSVQDQFIFVFNKYYLECEPETALRQLQAEPRLQPTIEDTAASTPPIRHGQLAASFARTAQMHHEHIQHLLQSLSLQRKGLQIASGNLDFNVLAISETFDGISVNGRKELEKQAALLEGLDADLELISQVQVHVEFCSAAVKMAIEEGEPHRVLADYVSKQKMKQVADTCAKTHDELQARFTQVEEAIARLAVGADQIRSSISAPSIVDEVQVIASNSQGFLDRITEAAAALENPASDADSLIQDLRRLDDALRQELQQVATKKNQFTRHCLNILRSISVLNNDIVILPNVLASLAASFRAKTSFSHINRLHNMLYAYGATVIEIVRRKEFSSFFYQRAQGILEVMAKVSSSERKRRQVYRSEFNGQLPFETKGMDDPVPAIDFTPTGTLDSPYSFERMDVDSLMQVLDTLEQSAESNNATRALRALRECRTALEKQIGKMDSLELTFDKIAERSLLSQSRLSQSRRRSVEADDKAIQALSEELQATKDAKSHQERLFAEERKALQAEINRLKANSSDTDTALTTEQERATRLERDLEQLRTQMESENSSRRILEARNDELSSDLSKQRNEIARALADATEQAREAERLRQQLGQVEADYEEVKQLEQRNADNVNRLLEEQANTLRHLEEARSRGEDLEQQIHTARQESHEVAQTLKEASLEKDRLLKAQSLEHDRIMRDHIAEADGDRAVLDRQFSELQAVLEHKERELKDLQGDLDISNSDAAGLREELQRVERELREARHIERLLRDDLKAGRASQHEFEQTMENGNRLVAQILDVALNFRNSHVKALHSAQAMTQHPGSTRHAAPTLADSTFSVGAFRHGIIGPPDEPSPIDPSDPTAALDALREFDHDHFLEAITKVGSTIRKWQKQCKEYRERAKGKISFRNFAKGDLALFLPTRNSVSKPWAAFNVSFPHYFLHVEGNLAEQLKTREWIVARIMSITERVVDSKDPTSNPYGLGDGVKYYMLEVEDWTQPSQTNKRRSSGRKPGTGDTITAGQGNEVSPPSGPSIRDLFQPNPGNVILGSSPPAVVPPPPPGPPEPEVEDTFLAPSPHLLSGRSRARSNSSPHAPPRAASSLSRLLAQASPPAPEHVDEQHIGSPNAPEIRSPSPLTAFPNFSDEGNNDVVASALQTSPSPVVDALQISRSPPQISGSQASPVQPQPLSVPQNGIPSPNAIASPAIPIPMPSPLRPGSRASRLSTTSRFSGRITMPVLNSQAKAAPTTALAINAQNVPGSPSSALMDSTDPFRSLSSSNPSGDESGVSAAMTSAITAAMSGHRRSRTTSYHAPRTLPVAATASQSTVVGVGAMTSPSGASSSRASSPHAAASTGGARPSLASAATLANIASNWGFGRKNRKATDVINTSLTTTVEAPLSSADGETSNAPAATPESSSGHAIYSGASRSGDTTRLLYLSS